MKVSFNSQEITPNEPEFFSGYSRPQKNLGVHDPILLNLLTISTEEYQLFLFSVDLLNVNKEFTEKVTQTINNLFSNENNIVIFSAIHTHSGPAVFDLPSLNQSVNPRLEKKLLDIAIFLAKKSQTFFNEIDSVLLERGQVNDFYGNRNNKEYYADKSFFTLKFVKNEKVIASLVNLACHPTVLKANNLLFSADLFSYLREDLAKKWQCPVILFNGACGDSSSRFFSKDSSFDEAKRLGSGIAEAIVKPNSVREISLDLINFSTYEEITYYDANQDEFWLKKEFATEKLDNIQMKEALRYHLNNKFNKIPKQTRLLSKQVHFDDLVILTFSGEVVSEFERYIRSKIDKPVLIICYEHDYISYMVNEEDYGAYFESYVSRLEKGVADDFVKKIVNLINND